MAQFRVQPQHTEKSGGNLKTIQHFWLARRAGKLHIRTRKCRQP